MNISGTLSDETLSAFLDGELSAAEMDAVREQVAQRPELATRLAGLATVDRLVRAQAAKIDAQPMPAKVLALLAADTSAQPVSNVVAFPTQRVRRWGTPLALAASLVLAVGVVLWRDQAPDAAAQLAYAAVLESAPSGTELSVGEGSFVSNFSYRDHDNRWCRQFRWRVGTRQANSIACRYNGGKWKLEQSVESVAGSETEYRMATHTDTLDKWLDEHMQGPAIDATAEAGLLKGHWQQ